MRRAISKQRYVYNMLYIRDFSKTTWCGVELDSRKVRCIGRRQGYIYIYIYISISSERVRMNMNVNSSCISPFRCDAYTGYCHLDIIHIPSKREAMSPIASLPLPIPRGPRPHSVTSPVFPFHPSHPSVISHSHKKCKKAPHAISTSLQTHPL